MKRSILFKTIILFLYLSVTGSTCHAQKHFEIPLRTGNPTENKGNENEALIQVFLPENSNGMAVLACPGGGYEYLELKKEGSNFASFFNEQDIALIVLKYRLPQGHADIPLADAEAAMRIIKEYAAKWNINPAKIGVMGSSAGGHLASTMATHCSKETRPAFQILLYPVISMKKELTHEGSCLNLLGDNPGSKMINLYSNELNVNDQTPPAFIVSSDDDKTVSSLNSINYYSALKQHNIPAEMHIYPTGGHGWALNDNFLYKKEWTEALSKWLAIL